MYNFNIGVEEPGNEAIYTQDECGKALVHCSLIPRLSSMCEWSLGMRLSMVIIPSVL